MATTTPGHLQDAVDYANRRTVVTKTYLVDGLQRGSDHKLVSQFVQIEDRHHGEGGPIVHNTGWKNAFRRVTQVLRYGTTENLPCLVDYLNAALGHASNVGWENKPMDHGSGCFCGACVLESMKPKAAAAYGGWSSEKVAKAVAAATLSALYGGPPNTARVKMNGVNDTALAPGTAGGADMRQVKKARITGYDVNGHLVMAHFTSPPFNIDPMVWVKIALVVDAETDDELPWLRKAISQALTMDRYKRGKQTKEEKAYEATRMIRHEGLSRQAQLEAKHMALDAKEKQRNVTIPYEGPYRDTALEHGLFYSGIPAEKSMFDTLRNTPLLQMERADQVAYDAFE